MSATLTSRLTMALVGTLTGSNDDFGPDSVDYVFPFTEGLLANGTGANQATSVYKGKLTITAGGSQTLDLYGGLTDPTGATLNITRIAGIAIYNANTVAGDTLTVGAAASNKWEGWTTVAGSTEKIGPGGVWLKWEPSAAGMVVANGSADNLKIAAPGANNVVAYVFVLGN